MKLNQIQQTIIISLVIGAVAGVSGAFFVAGSQKPSDNDLIKSFYETENAVYVSPHTLRKKMDKSDKNYILVDLRSQQEYEKEHIVGAVSIPTYKDPNTSISIDTEKAEKERIISEFSKLDKSKEVIVYCYSMPCMTGRKVGKLLAESNLYVKHLGVGWNEWRYFWDLWNHDAETKVDPKDYVVSGKEPGTPKQKELPSPCGAGELSC